MPGVRYTEQQLDWIKENYQGYPTVQTLTDAFNEYFGCTRTVNGIRRAMNDRCGIKMSKRQQFTPEEDAWLVENFPKYKADILTEIFVAKFDHKSSVRNIIGHCNGVLKIKSGRQSYKKGGSPFNVVPVGTERKTKEGYIMVKVGDKKSTKGDSATYHKNWKFKHVLIWEQHHGAIPDGHIIVFLVSNKENLDISNLFCIPQKVAVVMARNKWYRDNAEQTMTAIKWCELHFAIKGVGE